MRWINLDCVAGCAAVVRSHRLCRGSASSTVLVCRTVRLSGRLSVHCSAANDKEPINPAEALTKSLSEISGASGRVAQTRNVVLGNSDNSEEAWRALDEKVNTYPGQRTFKAIGVGGANFVDSMVGTVARVVGSPVHEESVQQRLSAEGTYISVTIGPVLVQNSDQVVQIYAAMREDERLKWYM